MKPNKWHIRDGIEYKLASYVYGETTAASLIFLVGNNITKIHFPECRTIEFVSGEAMNLTNNIFRLMDRRVFVSKGIIL